jgi:hypothetical protein
MSIDQVVVAERVYLVGRHPADVAVAGLVGELDAFGTDRGRFGTGGLVTVLTAQSLVPSPAARPPASLYPPPVRGPCRCHTNSRRGLVDLELAHHHHAGRDCNPRKCHEAEIDLGAIAVR